VVSTAVRKRFAALSLAVQNLPAALSWDAGVGGTWKGQSRAIGKRLQDSGMFVRAVIVAMA